MSMAELQTGRFKYNDGGWYVGQHCGDGKRHGQGIYTYPNGDVFDGSFIMGKCVSDARPCLPACLPGRHTAEGTVQLVLPHAPPGQLPRPFPAPPGSAHSRLQYSAGEKEQAPTSIRRAAGTRANGKTIAW